MNATQLKFQRIFEGQLIFSLKMPADVSAEVSFEFLYCDIFFRNLLPINSLSFASKRPLISFSAVLAGTKI